MGLNKSKGNMYGFVTHTLNFFKGKCPHDCAYCYMKRWKNQAPIVHFDKSELKTDLIGSGKFIFVGSSCDMFAKGISGEWIMEVLTHLFVNGNGHKYLFQSKDPKRMLEFKNHFPTSTTLGTTIETNRSYPEMGSAPSVYDRAEAMWKASYSFHFPTVITIEPIMDFDMEDLVEIIKTSDPDWVNIGANTSDVELPGPDSGKILELIAELEKITIVKQKDNLSRLL